MNRFLIGLFAASLALGFAPEPAQAKRLGGGTSSGISRVAPRPTPAAPTKPAPTAQPAQPAAAPAAAVPAAPAKRSWLGPLAGIAAGVGLAALMSHFGLSAEFGSLITMLLLAGAAVFVVRLLMQRYGRGAQQRRDAAMWPIVNEPALAGAGAPAPASQGTTPFSTAAQWPRADAPEPGHPAPAARLPADFDEPAFTRAAKLIFLRMQAANDAGNLDDLRRFATPEMFAGFRLELQDRQGAAQQTDVLELDAQILDLTNEATQQVASVRFHGLIREAPGAPAERFDETWHLLKPASGDGTWSIAGIAQNEPA